MNNQNLCEISRIVFPQINFVDNKELFVNKSENTINLDGEIKNVVVSKFNTWMNLFAAKKYYYYCDLGDLYLKLDIEGSYLIRVIGSNRSIAFDRVDTTLLETKCENYSELRIPNASEYDGVYFELIEFSDRPVKINRISYATDKTPQRDNKLAVVTCTFKREDYIAKNVSHFEQFIKSNPDLKGRIKWFIADNGKTLPMDLCSENINIYPNMNAGGAGGFTRGLMEVMNLNEGFTRVLFMDDDVEFCTESFLKTLLLSNFLNESHKDAFINGAMLNLYNKSKFFENLAIQHKLWVRAYHTEQELKYNNILTVNEIPSYIFENPNEKVDTAWWYHCFDISTVQEKGLPVPVFFRGDDVEWGWRNFGKHHISMNGICVWHAPFEFRVSKPADYYYLPRNMFMLNSLFTDNFKKKYKKLFKNLYKTALATYDYTSCELLIKTMQDILKGSDVYRENPQEQFLNINAINKKAEYLECSSEELEYAKFKFGRKKKIKKLLGLLTINGLLCPNFLFKKCGTTLDWYPPKEHFALVKEVKVYNLLTKKYELRKFDRKKILYYQKEFNKLLKQIEKNYDKLHDDFVESHKEFTTKEFWEKYLELNTSNTKQLQEVC